MRRLVLGVATIALATMTLSWAMAGDQDIARKITEQLRKEQEAGNLRGFNINLKVAEGNVRLEGQVSGEEQQELASTVARRVDGVKNVINDLLISSDDSAEGATATLSSLESATVDDADIAAEIARHLSEQKDAGFLKGFSVDVQVKKGEVTMKGVVTSLEQRARAMKAAESATGVKGILNQLVVKSPKVVPSDPPAHRVVESVANAIYRDQQAAVAEAEQRESDRQIGEKLTQALQAARDRGYLEGFGIGVHVDSGYAWLKGEVASEEQQQVALEIARRIPNVRQVINDLTVVETAGDESLNEIAQAIGDRLQTAESLGSLRGANMDVRVASDTILLTGVVANAEQEQLAVDLSRQVSGQNNVRSDLTIGPAAYAQTATANVDLATTELHSQAHLQPPMAIGPVPVSTAVPQPGYVMANGPMPQGMVDPANTQYIAMNQTPRPLGATRLASYAGAAVAAPFAMMGQAAGMGMGPSHMPSPGYNQVPARYDHPNLPGYAWPSYAAHPNYAAVTYPKQYSPTAWPYIGPFYPYPQVPLGWREVTLKWDDGWWQLDFNAK